MISSKRFMALSSLLALGALLAGCTPSGRASPRATAPVAAQPAKVGIQARIGTLPPQDLSAGTCGLFLWARSAERNMIFYATDRTATAQMMVDGKPVSLPRSLAEGDLVFGHYTTQEFAQGDLRVRAVIAPQPNSGIIGGAVVRRGMLNVSDGTGPDLVLPVAGLIACKAA
ncbi:hypothetical protein [Pedomonas mirosovicensis]|uniref:hypothetical protein n=1 Tax=Pedomonas mirosovicensis TaxID=2908641 RepID=UPI0021672AFE|nr:hypothetical protein [Pedomonas mirosovicensis]MCH8686337.1 hypothetical protein [Pedomonas mirosovicensis]